MSEIDLPEGILQDVVEGIGNLSFDAITITRASDSQAPVIVYVNDAFTELTGYPAAEAVGETPGMLQGSRTERAVLDRLDETVSRGETFHGRTINYRRDGSPFEMEWKVKRLGEEGGATYYLAVQRDGGPVAD